MQYALQFPDLEIIPGRVFKFLILFTSTLESGILLSNITVELKILKEPSFM